MARIEERVLKSGATVTLHTRLTFGEGRHIEKRRRELAKLKDEKKQSFEGLRLFVTGWTLRDLDSDELLPFDADGLERADINEVGEIAELMAQAEAGQLPNASSAKSPATSAGGSRRRSARTR